MAYNNNEKKKGLSGTVLVWFVNQIKCVKIISNLIITSCIPDSESDYFLTVSPDSCWSLCYSISLWLKESLSRLPAAARSRLPRWAPSHRWALLYQGLTARPLDSQDLKTAFWRNPKKNERKGEEKMAGKNVSVFYNVCVCILTLQIQ